jgi:hypothetical protein
VDSLESDYAGWSSYNYGFDNPVRWDDPSGMGGEDNNNEKLKQTEQSLERSRENLTKSELLISDGMDADAIEALSNYLTHIDDVVEGIIDKGDEIYDSIKKLPKLLDAVEVFLKDVSIPTIDGNLSESESAGALKGAQLIESATSTVLQLSQDLNAAMKGDAKALGHLIGEVIPLLLTEGLANYAKGQKMIRAAETASSLEKQVATTLSKMENNTPGAHYFSRHGAQTTLEEQYIRSTTGLTPDGVSGKPMNASRFLTHKDELDAVLVAQKEFTQTGKTSFSLTMTNNIGDGYLRGGGTYLTTKEVQAVFRNGKLYTLYPKLQ